MLHITLAKFHTKIFDLAHPILDLNGCPQETNDSKLKWPIIAVPKVSDSTKPYPLYTQTVTIHLQLQTKQAQKQHSLVP